MLVALEVVELTKKLNCQQTARESATKEAVWHFFGTLVYESLYFLPSAKHEKTWY